MHARDPPSWAHISAVAQEPRVSRGHKAEVISDTPEDNKTDAVDSRPRAVDPRDGRGAVLSTTTRQPARRPAVWTFCGEKGDGPHRRPQVEGGERVLCDQRLVLRIRRAVRVISVSSCGSEGPSEEQSGAAIRETRPQSMAIRPMAINGHQSQSGRLGRNQFQWQSMAINGNQGDSAAINGNQTWPEKMRRVLSATTPPEWCARCTHAPLVTTSIQSHCSVPDPSCLPRVSSHVSPFTPPDDSPP